MKRKSHPSKHFVVCIDNDGYPGSLDKRKIYRVIPDAKAEDQDLLRVVDESGEDYLYPSRCFLTIHLPKREEKAIALVC